MLSDRQQIPAALRKGIAKHYVPALLVLYVVVFMWQINMFPGERYPDWDMFWGYVRRAGMLFQLRNAVMNYTLPFIDLNTNLGWNLGGDIYSFHAIPNLLILILPPQYVLNIRTFIYLLLAALGAYYYLKKVTNDIPTSFFGGCFYIALPYIVSLHHNSLAMNFVLLTPFLFFFLNKVLEEQTTKWFIVVALYYWFYFTSVDGMSMIMIPAVSCVYVLFTCLFYYRVSIITSLRRVVFFGALSSMISFLTLLPLLYNVFYNRDALVPLREAGLVSAERGVGVDIIAHFMQYGMRSIGEPVMASSVLVYTPFFIYFAVVYACLTGMGSFAEASRARRAAVTLFAVAASMPLVSLFIYGDFVAFFFPNMMQFAAGVIRFHLNLIPFMLVLAGFICFWRINSLSTNRRVVVYLSFIAMSVVLHVLARYWLRSIHYVDMSIWQWLTKGSRGGILDLLVVEDLFDGAVWSQIFSNTGYFGLWAFKPFPGHLYSGNRIPLEGLIDGVVWAEIFAMLVLMLIGFGQDWQARHERLGGRTGVASTDTANALPAGEGHGKAGGHSPGEILQQ